MREAIWKLGVLRDLLLSAVRQWRSEVWSRDPDDFYCCPGESNQCGCYGVTVRDLYSPRPAPAAEEGER